ncbi:hypothetical protein PV410_10065 [Streptomyces sp. PA03-5A]|nr:hypothetical protein [Streptomyces sp. PA03-5A]
MGRTAQSSIFGETGASSLRQDSPVEEEAVLDVLLDGLASAR